MNPQLLKRYNLTSLNDNSSYGYGVVNTTRGSLEVLYTKTFKT